jgi:hypothetical protein
MDELGISLVHWDHHVPGLKDIMQTDYLDWQAYLLVVGMSFWPFIVHEIAKVVIFQRLGFNVY